MTTDSSNKDYLKHKCGECARFKVPDSGCWNSYDIQQGILLPSDQACDRFYPKHEKQKDKRTKKQTRDAGLCDRGHFEAIYHGGKPCFLVKEESGFHVAESVEADEQLFYPKEAKHVPYEPYGYFEGTVPNREELFWKVNQEFHTFVDVESIWIDILSACVLLSYHQEKLQTVPYIFVYGDNESGKSTVLQVLKFLCYRPMYGVTVPAADIYGFLEDSDAIGCILEDEVQGINKDTDKIKIYKAGYKQGAVVPRTILLQHDRIIKYYQTFCFKACASEQIPQVKGFRERFLEIAMVEGNPEKEWVDITQEDLKRLGDLRNVLLKWRIVSREWQLPDPELSMLKGRLKELWKPILQITHGLTVYNSLLNYVEEQRKERLSGKQNTLEGHIVKVIAALHNQAKVNPVSHISFQTIWQELAFDLEGKIDDKNPHRMETSEFLTLTKSKVGYRLREVLSGKTKVLREKDEQGNWVSIKAYEFDQNKLRRIAKKYGYELVTKLPSLPSSEEMRAFLTMEKTEEKNVEKDVFTPLEAGKLGNSVTRLSVREALEKMRSLFVEGTEEEWISFAIENGLTEQEAKSLFESLKGSELFWFEREGQTFWRWVRE